MDSANEVLKWSITKAEEEDKKSLDFLKANIDVTILNQDQKKIWANKLEPVKQSWMKKASNEEQKLLSWVESLK